TRLHRSNFLARNRIVAGLSDCLVVVESDIRGGSMSTARIASLYNRDVFALPGRISDIYSRGTNHLIANQTAQLITCADDLLGAMGWEEEANSAAAQPTLFPALTPELQELYDYIKANPDATVNDMCVSLGQTYATVADRLFRLEFEDMIISIPGGRYAPASRGC
ncbi:MAG: DNA-processing protein DprA, partial [Lachnospiraceae bacterium]|nr:DNA-processing protein DprA [Lachnospiraceae bacterium]